MVQVTRVAALMVRENGLNDPPPPAIVTLAVLVKAQLGNGLGLGEGLVPGEGLALGDGLGLEAWASDCVAPALRKMTPSATAANWTQNGRFGWGWCPECVMCC